MSDNSVSLSTLTTENSGRSLLDKRSSDAAIETATRLTKPSAETEPSQDSIWRRFVARILIR